METSQTHIHQRSINNAISAYFMIFVSGAFLFNKKDTHINNPFVKGHTKVAILIHVGFILSYLLFVTFDFLQALFLFGFGINYILVSACFFILLSLLLYGVYKASKGQALSIGDIGKITRVEKIIDVNGDNILDEKDIFTLILCHIPFIGYFTYGRYFKNAVVDQISYMNLLCSVIISILYIFSYINISLLLLLGYTIFAAFSCINIIHSGTIIKLNLSFIPKPETKISIQKAGILYIKNYIFQKDFVPFKEVLGSMVKKRKNQEQSDASLLPQKKAHSFFTNIIYLPFINILTLGQLKSNMQFHIKNGLMISLVSLVIIIGSYFYILPAKSLLLILFPICFGYGFLHSRPTYRMPYIYDLYETLVKLKNLFSFYKKTIKEKKAEVKSELHTVSGIPDPNNSILSSTKAEQDKK